MRRAVAAVAEVDRVKVTWRELGVAACAVGIVLWVGSVLVDAPLTAVVLSLSLVAGGALEADWRSTKGLAA